MNKIEIFDENSQGVEIVLSAAEAIPPIDEFVGREAVLRQCWAAWGINGDSQFQAAREKFRVEVLSIKRESGLRQKRAQMRQDAPWWFVTGADHTMVVLPPAETFLAALDATQNNEMRKYGEISHRVAVSSTEITIGQFNQFMKESGKTPFYLQR